MPLPKEFLDIYEEEMAKPEITNPMTQLFFRAPPQPKKKIPEWTSKGEIVWPAGPEERRLTPKEEEELSLMKEVNLLRQNANLGDRMESFVQGLLPVGDKEVLEKAFPISNLGGVLTRYALASQIIASELPDIAGYLAKPMQPLAQIMKVTPQFLADPITSVLFSDSFPRMAAFATQRALTWGGTKLGENIIRGVTGEDLNTKKLIWEPATAAGIGAMMGGVHGISGLWTSSAIAAGIGGGKQAIEKYIKEGKIDKQDIGDILLQAGFYGMVEAIGHEQNIKMWKSKEMQDFMHNRWYSRLLGQGQTPEEAEFGATLAMSNTGPAGNSLRRAVYEQTIKPNLPEQITNAKPEYINPILNNIRNNISSEKTIAQSIGDMVGNVISNKTPELLPVFEEYLKLPAPKSKEGLSTYNQMRYGKALEEVLKTKLKYTDEDIANIKQGKSFSYQKENAMSERQSAEVIKAYEDAIEQTSLHEGPQFKNTLREVDKLRMKYMGAQEKGVFDDVLRAAMPNELQKDIGKDWTLLDYIRPSWRAFRKDPVLWEHGHQPLSTAYGMKERFNSVAIQEARAKVKDLKLTGDDLRIVTNKRNTEYLMAQGQKDLTPIILNDRQAQWDGWLTKQFEALHSFFGLDKMIPFHQYIPWIQDKDASEKIEKGILSELYPEYLPKNITAFFENRRQSNKPEKFRENSLELYEMYIKAGSKKKYMLPALREARRYVIQNPNIKANLKSHFQDWGTWMMGYPSLADNSFTAMFGNMGLDYDNAYRIARMLMDLTYMGGLGFRPMSAVRNLFQSLNTAGELGYTWTTSGFKDFMFNGGTAHAKEKGVLMEYTPELYSEFGQYSNMQKLRDASLFLFRKADETNRSIAYYGAENKFNYHWYKYGNTDIFFQKSGLNFIDKTKRNQIRNLIDDGKIDEARHEFGKEIVAKTQYLYSKENSPLITRTVGGKLLFQFKSWPENYGELLADWGRNKNYMAFVRALAVYAALGFMGKQLNQKWLTRTIPIGTLPIDQWRMERALVPATLGPIADVLFLMGSPLLTSLETQDPEAVQKAFEKRLKALGKDTLLFLPGGLALKDFYKIDPVIPMFSPQPTPSQAHPSNLKFKSINQGKSPLKFKSITK